jgi:phospholipid/cholesterol/gamma-HCH transport system ATP-binding protein
MKRIRIEIKQIKKHFPDTILKTSSKEGQKRQYILQNVNLTLYDDEILVILGRNGCGKSVLFKIINALIPPDEGRIIIDGEDIHQLQGKELIQARKKIGFVFQKSGLFDSMTVGENVGFSLNRFSKKTRSEIDSLVRQKLAHVGLSGVEKKMPAELSGGMQKRAGLARAIIQNPEIILYDDPTAGLDPILSDAIGDLILKLKDDLCVSSMVITHDLDLVEKLADRVCLLYKGEIHGPFPWSDFQNSDNPVIKQYLSGSLSGPINLLE